MISYLISICSLQIREWVPYAPTVEVVRVKTIQSKCEIVHILGILQMNSYTLIFSGATFFSAESLFLRIYMHLLSITFHFSTVSPIVFTFLVKMMRTEELHFK